MEGQLLEALRQISIPKDNRRGVRKHVQDYKRGGLMGYAQNYTQTIYTASTFTQRKPALAKLLCDYVKEKRPDFRFSCIQVNEGASALHVDLANQGSSLIIALGNFTGGELYIYPDKIVDIQNKLNEFDGLYPHMTLPFEGERFSIVYFNLNPYNIKKTYPQASGAARFLRLLSSAC